MNINSQFNIVYPSENDKWSIADLWQDVFHDSPEYVYLFFNHVYKPENTLVVKRNGFVVSALQMIPYNAKLRDEIVPVVYICGACTHTFERGKGLMKALIHEAKLEMKRRGFLFAIVIPAEASLFDFYRKLGFTNPIHRSVEYLRYSNFIVTHLKPFFHYSFEECTSKHFQYFDRIQQARYRTIIHDASDFKLILQELSCDGGRSFVALENNIPVGIAFAEKISNDTILVKDIIAESTKVYTALCRYAFMLFDAQYIKIISPCHPKKEIYKYGLICNLDKKVRSFSTFNMSLMHD